MADLETPPVPIFTKEEVLSTEKAGRGKNRGRMILPSPLQGSGKCLLSDSRNVVILRKTRRFSLFLPSWLFSVVYPPSRPMRLLCRRHNRCGSGGEPRRQGARNEKSGENRKRELTKKMGVVEYAPILRPAWTPSVGCAGPQGHRRGPRRAFPGVL